MPFVKFYLSTFDFNMIQVAGQFLPSKGRLSFSLLLWYIPCTSLQSSIKLIGTLRYLLHNAHKICLSSEVQILEHSPFSCVQALYKNTGCHTPQHKLCRLKLHTVNAKLILYWTVPSQFALYCYFVKLLQCPL